MKNIETVTLPALKCDGEQVPNDFETVMALLMKGRIVFSPDAGAADYPLVFDDAANGSYVTAGAINAHGETLLTVEVGRKEHLVSQKSRHPLPGFQWRMK